MNESRLLHLIKTISPKSLKRLRKLVNSPYFNEHEETIALFEYIAKASPRFVQTRMKKEKVFHVLFPNKSYDDVRMRLLMSYLLKLVEEFLVLEHQKQQPLYGQLNLLQQYRQLGLDKHFESGLKKARQYQAKRSFHDADFFFDQYQIEKELNAYIEAQGVREKEPNLQELSDHLDTFYLINKLKCCCTILNYKNISQQAYRLPLVDEILQHLSRNDYSKNPVVQIYYKTLLSLTDHTDETHYKELKILLIQNQERFPKDELYDMFTLARNYCIKQLNEGNKHYQRELFEWYQHQLRADLILHKGEISPSSYKNVVYVGLLVEEYEWTEQFIYDYKDYLPEKFRNASFLLNLSRLKMREEAYQEAIGLLNQMDYEELFIALAAKTMLIQLYYELEEEEALYSLLDSFQIYLRRQKRLSYHQENYLNFIRFVRRLLKCKKEATASLMQEIRETPKLVERGWLLRKLASFS